MKKSKKTGLVLAGVALLGIGFAAISAATLTATTEVKVKGDASAFKDKIKFSEATAVANINGVNITLNSDNNKPIISADGQTITFAGSEVPNLISDNDYYQINYTITNESTQYDAANVKVTCKSASTDGNYNELDTTSSIFSFNQTAPYGTITHDNGTGTGNVQLSLKAAQDKDVTESFTCKLTADAVGYTKEN